MVRKITKCIVLVALPVILGLVLMQTHWWPRDYTKSLYSAFVARSPNSYNYSSPHTVTQIELIDDCCCRIVDVIDGSKHLETLLEALVHTKFFSIFKVALYKDCPFWISDHLCQADPTGGCGVCECDENDVPVSWRWKKDTVAALPEPEVIWQGSLDDMWTPPTEESELVYIDLTRWPERNTKYVGESSRIWWSIYNENCFSDAGKSECFQERVLYKLMSGLHTSVSTHLSAYYTPTRLDGSRTIQYTPSLMEFQRRILPERVHNLYFAYLFVLRAISKAAVPLKAMEYSTGDIEEQRQVSRLMNALVESPLMCTLTFDETNMFSSPEKMVEFAHYFKNITQLMDCVACEQCALWGKVQILGLGTALKLLMRDYDWTSSLGLPIQRNELIALINTARQFSLSIQLIEQLKTGNTTGIYLRQSVLR
eukprot:TRINITY_DN7663_c0_g1_i1.p1 TRINITY_DN7663_c0_g1~~TRINITY_DN7663_c0_g1_i1.p1  ORF type:complete len:425 (+),score=32.00 TRINITY_DN7663_c0_g1_i1:1263-2537(+)